MILKCPHCKKDNKIAGQIDPFFDAKLRPSKMICAFCEKTYTTAMCNAAEEREHPTMTDQQIEALRENARRHNQYAADPRMLVDAGQLQLICDEALKFREIVRLSVESNMEKSEPFFLALEKGQPAGEPVVVYNPDDAKINYPS